jgi:hypothetical protein
MINHVQCQADPLLFFAVQYVSIIGRKGWERKLGGTYFLHPKQRTARRGRCDGGLRMLRIGRVRIPTRPGVRAMC